MALELFWKVFLIIKKKKSCWALLFWNRAPRSQYEAGGCNDKQIALQPTDRSSPPKLEADSPSQQQSVTRIPTGAVMACSKFAPKRKLDSENRQFQPEWTERFAFFLPPSSTRPLCLICQLRPISPCWIGWQCTSLQCLDPHTDVNLHSRKWTSSKISTGVA